MKRNTYIVLTILCLLGIIYIQTLKDSPVPSSPERETLFNIDKEKIINSPYAPFLALLGSTYFILFVVGIGNLIFFLIHRFSRSQPGGEKLNKNGTLTLKRPFPLSDQQTSKLSFLIAFFVLLIQIGGILTGILLEGTTSLLKSPARTLAFVFLFNLLLEVGVAFLIVYFISKQYLNIALRQLKPLLVLRIYTMIIPLTLGALLLNHYILQKLGIPSLLNPAVEFLLPLKNTFLIAFLSFQIVVVAPIAEELFFRGFLYKFLRSKCSFALSAISVSLLFTLLHRTPLNILPLFIISFALCYVYEKTQAIITPITFHAIHNTFNLLFLLVFKATLP